MLGIKDEENLVLTCLKKKQSKPLLTQARSKIKSSLKSVRSKITRLCIFVEGSALGIAL